VSRAGHSTFARSRDRVLKEAALKRAVMLRRRPASPLELFHDDGASLQQLIERAS